MLFVVKTLYTHARSCTIQVHVGTSCILQISIKYCMMYFELIESDFANAEASMQRAKLMWSLLMWSWVAHKLA